MVERYAAMRAEVQKPAYSAMTPAEIRAILIARTIDVDVDVSVEAVMRRLLGQGIVGKVRAKMLAYEHALRSGAINEAAFLASAWPALSNSLDAFSRLPTLETSTAAVRAFITQTADTYVAEGCMTAQQRTQLLAMWVGKTSIADRDGFPDPTEQEIAVERARQ